MGIYQSDQGSVLDHIVWYQSKFENQFQVIPGGTSWYVIQHTSVSLLNNVQKVVLDQYYSHGVKEIYQLKVIL